MGSGSRGGNGGLSASGRRQRDDKARRNRRTIERETNPNRRGEDRNKNGGDNSRKNRRGLNGNGNGLNGGIPNWLLPNLHGGSKPGSSKGTAGGKKSPANAKKAPGIKKIPRTRPIKVKLTKQRKNQTPN